ncbi:MAG: hypothetical protein K0R40_3789, partial [Burkholderiales bacterium]|nr:hypothetical protein [Burkholderiales bacterium]
MPGITRNPRPNRRCFLINENYFALPLPAPVALPVLPALGTDCPDGEPGVLG